MTFFAHIESFFKKIEGHGKWEKIANTVLTVVAPILETAMSLTAAAPIESIVAAVIKDVQSDLSAMSALTSPTAAALPQASSAMNVVMLNVLANAKQNLVMLQANQKLSDPVAQAQYNAVLQAVIEELSAIQAAAPVPASKK